MCGGWLARTSMTTCRMDSSVVLSNTLLLPASPLHNRLGQGTHFTHAAICRTVCVHPHRNNDNDNCSVTLVVARAATIGDFVLSWAQFGVDSGFAVGKSVAWGASTAAAAGAATVVAMNAAGEVSQTTAVAAVCAAAVVKVSES